MTYTSHCADGGGSATEGLLVIYFSKDVLSDLIRGIPAIKAKGKFRLKRLNSNVSEPYAADSVSP